MRGADARLPSLPTTWPSKIDAKAAILWSRLAKLLTPDFYTVHSLLSPADCIITEYNAGGNTWLPKLGYERNCRLSLGILAHLLGWKLSCQVMRWFKPLFEEDWSVRQPPTPIHEPWERATLEVGLPAQASPQATATSAYSWLQLHERPNNRTPQLSFSKIPDPQELWDMISLHCCLKS